MSNRKEKRTKKYRGLRTHGAGNIKNRRGSGNRGGVGHAGLNKHKKTWMVKFAPDYFGNHGFVNPVREEVCVLNVFELDNMARRGALEKKGSAFAYSFEGKILGSGALSVPISVRAFGWSKKAEDKIKKAGGSVEKMEAKGKGNAPKPPAAAQQKAAPKKEAPAAKAAGKAEKK